jgi:hypothetical protein
VEEAAVDMAGGWDGSGQMKRGALRWKLAERRD